MTANAAIYAPTGRIIESEELCTIAAGAMVETSPAPVGCAAQFHVAWPDCKVIINVMRPEDIPAHIDGFLGWIWAVREAIGPLDDDSEQTMVALENDIADTKQVLGIVIEPELDQEGKCKQLIRGICAYCGGLFFAHDSIYTCDGTVLVGTADAPDYR